MNDISCYVREGWSVEYGHTGMGTRVGAYWIAIRYGLGSGWGIAIGYEDYSGVAIIFKNINDDFIPILLDIIYENLKSKSVETFRAKMLNIVKTHNPNGIIINIDMSVESLFYNMSEEGAQYVEKM